MAIYRVVAAVLDTSQLEVHYMDTDGQGNPTVKTRKIPQGDPRVARIVNDARDLIISQGYADVDLDHEQTEEDRSFAHVEQKSSGVMRFFRVAKKLVHDLFSAQDEEAKTLPPETIGTVPVVPAKQEAPKPAPVSRENRKAESTPEKIRDATPNQKMSVKDATDQIMKNAESVAKPGFSQRETKETETLVAVVSTDKGDVVVPGIENLTSQMAAAAKLGSSMAVQNFIRRMAAVMKDRRHSMEELLRFMSRGDLPIADDGSIIGYKVLRSTPVEKTTYGKQNAAKIVPDNYYVDCHSGAVLQRIGSLVVQENVDLNRRQECATGLHIARRGYLHGFSGDIITLVKIAPEDVLAVPNYDANKMRARAYHILFALPAEDHGPLRANRPIQSEEGKRMLAAAIRGDHIGIIEDVLIGQAMGGGLKVVPRNVEKTMHVLEANAPTAEALPILEEGAKAPAAPAVDARAVAEQVTERVTEVKAKGASLTTTESVTPPKALEPSVSEQRRLFEAKDWHGLYAFKKAKKKGWDKLGFTGTEAKTILANDPKVIHPDRKPSVPAPNPAAKKDVEAAVKKAKKGTEAKGESPAAKEVAQTHNATKSRREVISDLAAKARKGDKIAYRELLAQKKEAKKGWTQLGVNDFDAIQKKNEG